MAAPVKTETEWQWPAEVLAFAAQHNVPLCLQPLLQATRRIFPTANWIKVYVAKDPEIRDHKQIVFDVQVSGLYPPQSREAGNEWNRELIRCCPAPQLWVFVLLLDLQS